MINNNLKIVQNQSISLLIFDTIAQARTFAVNIFIGLYLKIEKFIYLYMVEIST